MGKKSKSVFIILCCIINMSIQAADFHVEGVKVINKCVEFKNSVCDLDLLPNSSTLATSGSDGTAEIWNGHTEEISISVFLPEGFRVITFSADGKTFATGSFDNNIYIWNGETGKPVAKLEGHTGMITNLVFSLDGKHLLSASADDTARLWSLTSKVSQVLSEHDGDVWALAFSPDSQLALTGGEDNLINVFQVNNGKKLAQLADHDGAVLAMAFNKSGSLLASGGDDYTLRIWDTKTWQQVKQFKGEHYSIYDLVFSFDGRYIAFGGRDKGLIGEFFQYHWGTKSEENDPTLWVYDIEASSIVFKGRAHSDDLKSVRLSADGKFMYSSGVDGTVAIYTLTE
jgi:WD40 repeat protein